MPQHEVLAFGSGTGNIPYVLSFGNRGPCRTTSNRQHQNGIADSWRKAWHGTKSSRTKLTVKQIASVSPERSAVPRPSKPANPTIPLTSPIVTESLKQTHQGVSYQTNTKDPFQIAISQGVQDGDTWVHNHVKNLIRRSIIVAVIVVAVCIVVFGVMGVRTSQKMRELNAINDCRDAVAAMNASYSKDFQLKGKIVDAFSSMDSSYDLEKLSTLYKEEVKSPKALDCKADPSGTTSKANTERAAYDKQARTFERALTKNEANQN